MLYKDHDANNANSADARDSQRKKILFRAQHRGMKEMDLLLGEFVAQNIRLFSDKELDQLEQLLACDDQDLYNFVLGRPSLVFPDDFSIAQSFAKWRFAR